MALKVSVLPRLGQYLFDDFRIADIEDRSKTRNVEVDEIATLREDFVDDLKGIPNTLTVA